MTTLKELETRLWETADELRANSNLKASEYSLPVLGLIFLRYADFRFEVVDQELQKPPEGKRRRRTITKDHYLAKCLYLPESARWEKLNNLTDRDNVAKIIADAMKAIEAENPDLDGVLPKTEYSKLENDTLRNLIKSLNFQLQITEGDVFGKIYEYFLGKFAMSEGQRGGQFFTPTSLVRLIVEIIQPYQGKIYDPCCGSGGMFVQSVEFIQAHQGNKDHLSIYGQERMGETVRLGLMNLAVHALSGDLREGNTYYEDIHESVGQFDFVMSNPPFNVDKVNKDKIGEQRFPFDAPTVDNANYLWIQMFYSALNASGRAGFVMANSASDARGTEAAIREKLIQSGAVDVMVSIGSNFFYTVTLPCTLWFFDKGKAGTPREDQVLFLDARQIFRQVDRAHRKFSPKQMEFLANIARLYRGEEPEFLAGEDEDHPGEEPQLSDVFPDGVYVDVPGLCKVATREEIAAQGWSLNPGRYVGVTAAEPDDFEFTERLQELNEELEQLNTEAHTLEQQIAESMNHLLEG